MANINISCIICGAKFVVASTSVQPICLVCSITIKTNQTILQGTPIYRCNICYKTFTRLDSYNHCYTCALAQAQGYFGLSLNSLERDANLNLMKCKSCNNDVFLIVNATQVCVTCNALIKSKVCPACGNIMPLNYGQICANCRNLGMDKCPRCNKWTNKHITMVNACYDCVQNAFGFQTKMANANLYSTSVPYGSTVPNTGFSAPSPISPDDSVFRDSNRNKLDRDRIYTLFHRKAEVVLAYKWVAEARDTLAPMIDMVILAILNEIFEELGYETIDMKFFKEM